MPNISNLLSKYFHKNMFNNRQILIFTDLEPDDEAALAILIYFLIYHIKLQQFPIYGIIVGESSNINIKLQRAHTFLDQFAKKINCKKSKNDIYYTGYLHAKENIYFDDTSNKTYPNEYELLHSPNINNFNPKIFSENTIQKLKQIDPQKLFILYLKPLRFFNTFKHRLDFFQYLQKIPGAIYGSWNIRCVCEEFPHIINIILRFLNRTINDAPLLYVESFNVLEKNNILTPDNTPLLFKMLENIILNKKEHNSAFGIRVAESMLSWNKNLLERHTKTLSQLDIFTDIKDRKLFMEKCKEITDVKYEKISKIVYNIIKYNGYEIVLADPLVILAIIAAIGEDNDIFNILTLKSGKIEYGENFMQMSEINNTNTWILTPTQLNNTQFIQKYVEQILINALQ